MLHTTDPSEMGQIETIMIVDQYQLDVRKFQTNLLRYVHWNLVKIVPIALWFHCSGHVKCTRTKPRKVYISTDLMYMNSTCWKSSPKFPQKNKS